MCLNIQYNTDSHTCQHVLIVFSTTASSYEALNTCAHAYARVCLYECVCLCVCVAATPGCAMLFIFILEPVKLPLMVTNVQLISECQIRLIDECNV